MGTGNSTSKDHRILLTGGSGFLGRAMLKELLLESPQFGVKEVKVFDLQPVKGFNDPRLSYVEGDVRDVEKLQTSTCLIPRKWIPRSTMRPREKSYGKNPWS